MSKRALVIGLGVSGKASAEFLLSLGIEVFAIDQQILEYAKHPDLPRLVDLGMKIVEEKTLLSLKEFSLVVPSPGVPSSHFLIKKALEEGIEVIGEAELGFRHMRQKAVAITGTNGKTTVTALVEHILLMSGKKAKALGNIGTPLTRYFLDPDPEEIVVAELSSYQLETMGTKVFDAAVVLNITPDHLDRYAGMRDYAKAKARIESCVKNEGTLYLYEDVVSDYKDLFSESFQSFGLQDAFKAPFLEGDHDQVNVEAAWLLCSSLGVSKESFSGALQTFKKPAHRIEFVRKLEGVSYYDDSKGTNVDAVIRAVEAMKGPVVLVAGGVDKGSSYLPWKKAFQNKVKRMFLIGESASKIQRELGLFFNVEIVDSLENAVQAASAAATSGDCVLLSPGCSSFDMFRDYAERGSEFQRFVCLLEERNKKS